MMGSVGPCAYELSDDFSCSASETKSTNNDCMITVITYQCHIHADSLGTVHFRANLTYVEQLIQ